MKKHINIGFSKNLEIIFVVARNVFEYFEFIFPGGIIVSTFDTVITKDFSYNVFNLVLLSSLFTNDKFYHCYAIYN